MNMLAAAFLILALTFAASEAGISYKYSPIGGQLKLFNGDGSGKWSTNGGSGQKVNKNILQSLHFLHLSFCCLQIGYFSFWGDDESASKAAKSALGNNKTQQRFAFL